MLLLPLNITVPLLQVHFFISLLKAKEESATFKSALPLTFYIIPKTNLYVLTDLSKALLLLDFQTQKDIFFGCSLPFFNLDVSIIGN